MFTIKIYEQNGTFIRTINEINDLSFSSQINGGQGELRVETADEVVDMAGKVMRVVQTIGNTPTLVYSGIIGKITRRIEVSRELYEVRATGLASLLSEIMYIRGGIPNFTVTTLDPSSIIREIIDRANVVYPGLYSYTASSIVNTGQVVTVSFLYESCLTSLGKIADLTEFWWHIDETGLVSFRPRAGTADHRLTIGENIESITIEYDSENIVNDYSLTWQSGTENWIDTASITAYGRRAFYENKSQIQSGALAIANAYVNENKEPKRKVSAVVNAVYQYFTITPGEIIQFQNISPNLPPLQVARISYNRNEATIELEEYNSLSREILT